MENEHVKMIIKIIKQQTEIAQDLQQLSLKIRTAVENSNINEIDKLVRVQTALVMKFSADEKRIIGQFSLLRDRIGFIGDDFTVKDLQGLVDKKSIEEMQSASEDLKTTFVSLEQANYTNKLLIKSKLDLVERSLDFIHKNEVRTYKTDGKVRPEMKDILNDLI